MREDDDYAELAAPAEQRSRAQQNNLVYGGLIAIGVVILQGFLTADPLGTAARISVLAFAVALPLLAMLIMLGARPGEQSGRTGATRSVALGASALGVLAAFWQIDWLAGLAVLVAGAVAAGVYGAHVPGSRFGLATSRFRRSQDSQPPADHQPPPPRHPYPTGPEAPTAFIPHPARQAQQQYPHGATERFPSHPPQHPGAQQYPGQGPSSS
ncbi:hypothetical protein AB0H76_14650 [Nocardia sp. NPDC050712]|uniref:hypothetical protein n=1 Tax=Nocardia sp. NPDC050712 TaxID=3155518 RepID=UPI0033FBE698